MIQKTTIAAITATIMTAVTTATGTFLPHQESGVKSAHIIWKAGKNVNQKDDGNTISNAIFCNSLTNPHKQCASCGHGSDGYNDTQHIKFMQKTLSRPNPTAIAVDSIRARPTVT